MENEDLKDVRERAVQLISERALGGEDTASQRPCSRGGWRLVAGAEGGLCEGSRAGRGSVRGRSQGAGLHHEPLGHGKGFGFSLSEIGFVSKGLGETWTDKFKSIILATELIIRGKDGSKDYCTGARGCRRGAEV